MARGAFVSGWLRIRSRPGRPDQGLPGGGAGGGDGGDGGGDYYPDQGLPGEQPEIPTDPLPQPPPGIWPPPTPDIPVQPLPPGGIQIPPGSIWPPTPGLPPQKFVVVVWIPRYGYRYTVLDPSQVWPTPPKPQPK